MQIYLMKKLIVLFIFIMLLASCGAAQEDKIDYSPTYIAQTVSAWELTLNESASVVEPTSTYVPTPTQAPTESSSVIDQVVNALEFGYCPEGKAKAAIAEIRALLENSDTQSDETESGDLANLILFENEEERLTALRDLEKLTTDLESVQVPECLRYSKSLYLKSLNDTKKIFENYSFENDDGTWFGELISISITYSLAEDEVKKIEQCLPNCKE